MSVADPLDQQLLNLLQDGLPLVRRPYDVLADRLGVDTAEVLSRIGRLREQGVIRQISAIFDTRSLGYRSTLVAASVPPERIDAAARFIDEHPGVSHNYGREHAFNLWFTIAVPPDSRLGLEGTVNLLGRRAGATSIRMMPTLRVFKIGMKLDMREKGPGTFSANEKGTRTPFDSNNDYYDESRRPAEPLAEEDTAVVRELQWDMPAEAEPYNRCAAALGLPIEKVLACAARLQQQGHLRRVAAVLHHRTAGFGANGMAVWVAPEEQIDACGERMATFPEVTHCYRRPTYPDWLYNLFAMVHARDRDGCRGVVERIAEATGLGEYDVLYSTTQYKKIRLRYFTPEIRRWEENVGTDKDT